MDQKPGALYVAQELMAQASACVGPLNEAGNVGQDEIAVVHRHHTQVGLQSSEGVVGNLGSGSADGSQ